MDTIAQTDAYLAALRNLVESEQVLQKHGYTTQPLTEHELLLKRRCLGCGKSMSQLAKMISNRSRIGFTSTTYLNQPFNASSRLPTGPSASTVLTPGGSTTYHSTSPLVPVLTYQCNYHPGRVVRKYWSCCSQHASAQPCSGSETHNPQTYAPGELTTQYQFHNTPETPYEDQDIRAAVSLDCEMGVAASGDSELIRVTMIDYFSGEVLVNNFVEPDVRMQHLNTRFSGVSWADISNAKRNRSCLRGKAQARKALWNYISPATVVVGHGASNDLRALRWIHPLVVDSYVTEHGVMKREEAEIKNMQRTSFAGATNKANLIRANHGKQSAIHMSANTFHGYGKTVAKTQSRRPGNLSLKTLVKQYLDRDIQTGGKSGHDSLEDAIAARDLVHWIITNPEHK